MLGKTSQLEGYWKYITPLLNVLNWELLTGTLLLVELTDWLTELLVTGAVPILFISIKAPAVIPKPATNIIQTIINILVDWPILSSFFIDSLGNPSRKLVLRFTPQFSQNAASISFLCPHLGHIIRFNSY